MSRDALISKTVAALKLLPVDKAQIVADFAEFMFGKYVEADLQKGIENSIQNSAAFAFLKGEEDIYTLADLKEKY